MTELAFLTVYLLNVLLISFSFKKNTRLFALITLVNMLIIPICGAREVMLFGFRSNITNLNAAAIFFSVSLMISRDFKETVKFINSMFAALISYVLLRVAINNFPIVEGNEQISLRLAEVFSPTFRMITASFLAFYLSNIFNIYVIQNLKVKPSIRKIIGNVGGQFLDSFIFFPMAFSQVLSLDVIFQWALSGWLIKSVLNILDTPLWCYAVRKKIDN